MTAVQVFWVSWCAGVLALLASPLWVPALKRRIWIKARFDDIDPDAAWRRMQDGFVAARGSLVGVRTQLIIDPPPDSCQLVKKDPKGSPYERMMDGVPEVANQLRIPLDAREPAPESVPLPAGHCPMPEEIRAAFAAAEGTVEFKTFHECCGHADAARRREIRVEEVVAEVEGAHLALRAGLGTAVHYLNVVLDGAKNFGGGAARPAKLSRAARKRLTDARKALWDLNEHMRNLAGTRVSLGLGLPDPRTPPT